MRRALLTSKGEAPFTFGVVDSPTVDFNGATTAGYPYWNTTRKAPKGGKLISLTFNPGAAGVVCFLVIDPTGYVRHRTADVYYASGLQTAVLPSPLTILADDAIGVATGSTNYLFKMYTGNNAYTYAYANTTSFSQGSQLIPIYQTQFELQVQANCMG